MWRRVKDFFHQPSIVEQMRSAIQSYGFAAKIVPFDVNLSGVVQNKRHLVKRIPFYIGTVTSRSSLGTIEISRCPIRWVNILIFEGYEGPKDYVYVFIIPDKRLRDTYPIQLKTVVRRNFPWIGVVTSLKWNSKSKNMDIVARLDNLSQINQTLMNEINTGYGSQIEIDTENIYGNWVLSVNEIPTQELWECYQGIAREILSTPISIISKTKYDSISTFVLGLIV